MFKDRKVHFSILTLCDPWTWSPHAISKRQALVATSQKNSDLKCTAAKAYKLDLLYFCVWCETTKPERFPPWLYAAKDRRGIHGFGGMTWRKKPLGRPWCRWDNIIKIDFQKVVLAQGGTVTGSCEWCNEPSGSIKCGEFLD